jgi:GGDEF domain-containing protein
VGRFISHARRLQNLLTFLLIDIDQFKDVSTRFGHPELYKELKPMYLSGTGHKTFKRSS